MTQLRDETMAKNIINIYSSPWSNTWFTESPVCPVYRYILHHQTNKSLYISVYVIIFKIRLSFEIPMTLHHQQRHTRPASNSVHQPVTLTKATTLA